MVEAQKLIDDTSLQIKIVLSQLVLGNRITVTQLEKSVVSLIESLKTINKIRIDIKKTPSHIRKNVSKKIEFQLQTKTGDLRYERVYQTF